MDLFYQIVLNSIIAGAIYTMIALGFNLVYGITKFFNITHGALLLIGAYTVLFLYRISGLNLFLSVFAGILTAGISGRLSDKLIFLPLRKRKATALTMFVASLGLFIVLQTVIMLLFTSQYQSLAQGDVIPKAYEILGGVITKVQVIIIIAVILITMSLTLVLNKTKFGKAIKAITDDEEVAKVLGINTDGIISSVFFIGSALAGLSGILTGFDIGIMPSMGMELLLKGIIASIIGGAGNIYGSILGGFLLGFIENFSVWKIPGAWENAIAFSLLIIFLLFRPQGILNK